MKRKRKRRQEVPVVAGFPGHTREIRVQPREEDAAPWGLDTAFKVVGKRNRRVGGDKIVTGRAKYSADVNLPGLLYGVIVRSPHPSASLGAVDFAEAEKLDGVRATFSFGKKQVRYAGDEVAAVAATTPEIAREAAGLVRVEYAPDKEFNVSADAAMADDAPAFMRDARNEMTQPRNGFQRALERCEQAIAAADERVEATYRTQVQTHSPLESHGMVVRWDDEESMTVWASTQATFGVREQLGDRFKLNRANVRVLSEFVGGGFGSKFSAGAEGIACAELARKAGAPVKLMLDRREEHLAAGNRPNSVQKVTAGINRDGTITGWKVESYGTGGVRGGARIVNPMIYEVGEVAARHVAVATNAGEERAFRAPGHPQGSFALEQMIDELAEKIGMDPLELRRKVDPSELRRYEYVLGAKEIGWERRPAKPEAGRRKRGMGVASTRWGTGPAPAQVEVVVHRDGSVEVRNGAQDIGTGTKTLLAVVAAEEFGLEPDAIKVVLGDTQHPIGPASGGSVTAISVTPAVRTACKPLLDQLRALAAAELRCDAAEVAFEGGEAVGGGKRASFKKICGRMEGDTIAHTGARPGEYTTFLNEVCGCQFAEVEVDTETGVIRPIKIVAVQDCGRVVNLSTAESQVIGGVIMGISYALFEDRVMDERRGLMVNPDFLGYKIAGPLDMPEIVPIMVEMCNAGNNVGMARLGEPPTIPTAAAIANAVANATGRRVRALPMTPDKVLEA